MSSYCILRVSPSVSYNFPLCKISLMCALFTEIWQQGHEYLQFGVLRTLCSHLYHNWSLYLIAARKRSIVL